jgi:hypothetical protein
MPKLAPATVTSVLLLAAQGSAQALPAEWQPRLPGIAGQNDHRLGAAWHAGARAVITVGASGSRRFDWRTFQPLAGAPPARIGAAMAYDAQRGRVVLFGGSSAAGGSDLGDTWEYDGTSWTLRAPANAPGPRTAAALAYDHWRGVCVLTGGFANGLGLGDTHEWNGSTWAAVTVRQPGLRGAAASTFDRARGYVLLFGGATTASGPARNDFWRYDGTDWVRFTASSGPSARADAAMAFDPWTGRTLLFGGTDAGGAALGDTWEWNGAAWAQLAPSSAPAARSGHALVLDEQRHQLTLLGGQSAAGARDEVWSWGTDPRPYSIPYGTACGAQIAARAGSEPVVGGTFEMQVGTTANLMFVALGFSNLGSAFGPLPVPLPAGGCGLWIDPAATLLFNPGPGGLWPFPIPAGPALIGVLAYAQTFVVSPNPLAVASSNGLELRIGVADADSTLTTPIAAAALDPLATASAAAIVVGGDGVHGSFDPTVGAAIASNVYEFSTDSMVIPARLTRSGVDETVVGGRFSFTDFVVPAGTTVRFRGANPAQIFVRGSAVIAGVVDANAAPMDQFVAGGHTPPAFGQSGGGGGPGGGSGGRGGDRCDGLGPNILGGVNLNSGAHGDDARVPAGHPLQAAVVGTGGRASALFPAHGLSTSLATPLLSGIICGDLSAGGGGGGLRTAGAPGAAQSTTPGVVTGPPNAGGTALVVPVVPSGVSSLDYYRIGGAGGGGGASHPFLAISPPLQWRAGAAGSGGGGVIALRCGRDLTIGAAGSMQARGGQGAVLTEWIGGYPSAGGAGSGGTILLQAAGALQNLGSLDAAGGTGSRIAVLPPWVVATCTGGDGAPGLIRLESPQAITGGTTIPPLQPNDTGPLLDTDARTGLRTIWLPIGTPSQPGVIERYELDVVVNGTPTTFSDDPAHGQSAADPTGAIVAVFQGTRATPAGTPDPAAVGPWRKALGAAGRVDNCNRDVPAFVRLDLAFPRVNRPTVQTLRIVWR